MSDYDRLIDDYRVSVPTSGRFVNGIAYTLGGFLLLAPFIRGVALPMAVFSLGYFFSVFLTLLIIDVGKVVSLRLQKFVGLQVLLPLERFSQRMLVFQTVVVESLHRNALAWRRALALWETRFFSVSPASPNVLPSSAE